MVSVITGSGLGLVNTSRGVAGTNGELGQGSVGRAGERLTVNAANGNLVVQSQDGLLVGVGPDVGLVRTYNSQGGWDGDNNDAWRLGFYRRIAGLTGTLNTAGSTLRRVEADGNEALFTFRDGRYVSTDGAGAYDTLVVTASTATWTDGDSGITETYLSAGSEAGTWRLTQITDTEGHSVRVTYGTQGLIDTLATWKAGATTADETVKLVYDANKRLTQIDASWRDDAGTHNRTLTRYTYEAGRLQSVITDLTPDDGSVSDGKTYTVTYGYDSAGRLSALTQSDGTSLTILYESGRVKTITDALGQVTTFTYDITNRKTTVSDARGQAAVLGYDTANRLLTLGGAVTPLTLAYDSDGNILNSTDGLNRKTQFAYDAQGNLTRSTDASGRVLDSVSDSANRLTSQTQHTDLGTGGTALTIRYVYDTSNGLRRLRFTVSAEGRVTEQQYNSLGQVQTRISYATNRFSGDATLAALTTWAGQQLTAGAAVQRQTFTYDLRGALRTQSDGRTTTTYVYDPFGRLVQTIDPQAGTTSFSYDGMDRLLLRTDSLQVKTVYAYDDAGRTSSVTWANGLRDVSTYDTTGQLLTQAQFNGTTALGQTRYAYDKAGRLRMVTDPTGQRRWQLYDDAGRLTGTVDALGHLTEITYDAAGRAVLSTGYAAAVDLTKLVDAQGTPIDVAVATLRPASDPNDRRQWSVYDEAGRLLWQVNSLGEATETRYDGAGRVVAKVQHGQRVASLPAAGSAMPLATLTGLGTNASEPDHVSRSFYDAEGLLRGTLDAEGTLTEMRYDAAGRLVERIAYATATPQAQRAAGTLATLTPASSDDHRRSLGWYDAQGRTVAELDADGFLTEHTYNNNGQRTQTLRYVTGLAVAAAKAATPATDPATLRPAASTEDHRTSWTYEVLGRVRTETGADGAVTQYTYDDLGRLTRSDRALGTTDQRSSLLRYDAQGRVVAELSALGATQLKDGQTQAQVDAIWAANSTQHAYDAAGRRIRSTDARGSSTVFYYDATGRQVYRILQAAAGGEVQASRYTAFGETAQTTRYSRRLSLDDTAALTGGLADAALDGKIAALADASDQRTQSIYNPRGLIQQAIDALGFKTDYSYNAFGLLSRSEAAAGSLGDDRVLRTDYAYDRRGLQVRRTQDPLGLALQTQADYDAFGRQTASVDARGDRSTTRYVAGDGTPGSGRQVIVTDATGASRSTTYDAFDRVLRQTDALGQSMAFSHDTANRRVTMTSALGIQTITQHSRHGQVVQVTDGTGAVTTYDYDPNGNLLTSTDALGQVTRSSYDGAGNRVTLTGPGHTSTTRFEYDAANRLLVQTVDPDGLNLRTVYTYDGQGRAVAVTDPAGTVTSYRFNGRGELTDAVVDDSATGLRLKTTTRYDAQGRTLSVTEGAGTAAARTTEYRYDLLGRRTQEIVDPAGLKLSTRHEYDAAGYLVLTQDALGALTRYVHDVANRRVYTLDALGGVKRDEHDAAGRLIQSTRYATRVALDGADGPWTLARLEAGLVAAPGQDAVTSYRYDADGRLRFTVDAAGAVTETRRDAAGRVTHTRRLAGKLPPGSAAAPEDVWQRLLAAAADPAQDSVTRQMHDAAGRLVLQIDAMGGITRFGFDAAGRVTRTIRQAQALPTGAAADLDDAALMQRVLSLADPARDSVTRHTYDAAGRLQCQVDAQGAVTETRYDAAGRVTETVQYANMLPAGGALQVWRRAGTNSSAARPLGNFKAGDVVTASVRFKTSSLTGARLFLGDPGGPDPYDNMRYSPVVYGDDGWQSLQVSVTLTHDDALWVYVYGDRDGAHADDSHSVLYDNVQVSSVLRGLVLQEEFDQATIDPAWRLSSVAQQVATPAADADSQAQLAQRIAALADPTRDRSTRRAYDAAGREVYRIDALGGVTETRYDAAGRAVETIAYSRPIRTEHYNTPASDPAAWHVYAAGATGGTIARVDDADRGGSVISLSGDGWNTGYRLTRDAARSPWNSRNTVVSWDMKYDQPFTVYLSVQTNHGHRYLAYRAGTQPPTGAGTSEYVYHFLGDQAADGRWHHFQRDLSADLAEMQPDTQILSVEAFLIRGSGRVGTVSLQALATGAAPDAIAAQLHPAADDRHTRTVYDAAGRVVQHVDAAGYLSTYTHDALGRVLTTARYAAAVQRPEALGDGRGVSVLPAGSTPPASGAWLIEQDPDATARSTFEYDLLGHRTRSADLGGAVESATFNAFGDAITRTNARGGTARFLYDTMGRLIQETLPVTAPRADGTQVPVVNRYEYDARGNRIKTIEAQGLGEERTTLMRFDANDRLVRRIGMAYAAVDAAGATRWVTPVDAMRYDAAGRLIEQIDHATLDDPAQPDGPVSGGRRTLTWYDPSGRKHAELSADGVLTRLACNSTGEVVAHTVFATRLAVPAQAGGIAPSVAASQDDRTVRLSYDALGRKTETRLDGVWTWENGQPVTLNGVPDARGQGGSTQPQTLTLERLEYDTAGNVTRRFDARGNATCSYYDALGRKLLEVDPAGYAIAWDYDRPGATATQETRYARTVPVAYGPAGSGTTPQALRAALAAAGSTADSGDRSGDRVTQFKLDRLGRVVERAVLNVAFTHVDAAAGGRPAGAMASAVTRYTYDGMGQVTQVRQRVAAGADAGTEVWQVTDIDHDALGRETHRAAPGYIDATGRSVRPVTDSEYDGLGHLARTLQRGADDRSEADDRITVYTYDRAGQVVEVRAADGGVVCSAFDAQGHVARQTHLAVRRSDGSTRDLVKTWRHDAVGRVIETQDLGTGESRQTRYTAFGDIAAQGSNGGWQEWAEYTMLGKVWKTNSGDGAVKVYLHDGNGNVTRELRAGVGEGGSLRQATLADLLADDTLAGTVNVYDGRNLLVQTIEPRIGWLENGVTLKQQYTQHWVPQWADLNVPSAPARPYPAGGLTTGTAYTTVTASEGNTRLLGAADPAVRVGGMQLGAPLDRGGSLAAGSLRSLDAVDLDSSLRSARSKAPNSITTSLRLPASSARNSRYRVVETFGGVSKTLGTGLAEGSVIGLATGAAGRRTVRIDMECPPAPGGNDPLAYVPVAEVEITKSIYSYEPGTPGADNVFFSLNALSQSSGRLFLDSNDWGKADSLRMLVQPPSAPAGGTSLAPAGRQGRIVWFNTNANPGKVQVLGLNAQGQLVAAQGISAGALGTVWAENQRRADGSTSRTTLSWSLDGGGDAVLRWRRSDSPQRTWYRNTVPASATSLRSVDLLFADFPGSFDGDYEFIIEQGTAMRAGSFRVDKGAITISETRLRDFSLADEQVSLAGVRGGRAQLELKFGPQAFTFTPDAVDPDSGRATFNLSRIRSKLGLDRWSTADYEYSYAVFEAPESGGHRLTHSEHGWLELRPPRTAAGAASFQFLPRTSGEYAAEGLIRLPAGDGKLTLTPDIGTPLDLPLDGSDSRLQRSTAPRGDWILNLDSWRPAKDAEPRLVAWSYASADGQLVTGMFWIDWDGQVLAEGLAAVTTHRTEVTLTPPTGTRTVVLEVRPAGSAAYQRLTPKDASAPPVFNLAGWRPASGSAALDYVFSAYDGTGALLGRSVGALAIAADGSTTHTPGAVQYQPARVSLQPPAGTQRVVLRLTLEDGRSVALAPEEASGWTYNLQPYVLNRSRSLDYSFETFDTDGKTLTRGQGRLSIGPDGSVSATVAKEHRPVDVAFRITGRPVPQAQLSLTNGATVRLAGTWVPPVRPVNPDGTPSTEPGEPGYTRFDWDASASGLSGVTVDLDYTLAALDAAGTALNDEAGRPVQQVGKIQLSPNTEAPVRLLHEVKRLNQDKQVVISRRQAHNAFGEVVEEYDERVAERMQAMLGREPTPTERAEARTTLRYNALGLLVARIEAQTDITAANGYRYRDRPTTTYGYDLLGRQILQIDANGHALRRSLLAGSADTVTQQWAADGGERRTQHDVFGDARRITETISATSQRVTEQGFDALGRLTRVGRRDVQRVDATGVLEGARTLTDSYTYDQLGQRLSHIDALMQTTRADYDTQGRITATVSAAGFTTTYRYEVAPGVTGVAAAQGVGTQRTTTQADGRTQVDRIDYFGHTTWHRDLIGTEFTYTYDRAARLVRQTGTARSGQPKGQDIRYLYYANGYLQSSIDSSEGTRADYAYDDAGNRVRESYHRWVEGEAGAEGTRVATYQNATLHHDELNRIARVEDANYFDVRYEFDAVGNRRLVDSVYWDGAAGQRGRQTYWYDYDAVNRFTVTQGTLSGARATSRSADVRIVASAQGTALGYDWLGQRREAIYTFKDPAKPGDAGTLIRESYGYSLDGYLQTLHQNGSLKQVRVLDAIGRTTQLVETQNKTSTVSRYDADNRLLSQQFTDTDDAARNSTSAYFYYDDTSDRSSSAKGTGMLARVVTRVGGRSTPAPPPPHPYPLETPIEAGAEDATPQSTGGTEVTTTYRYDYWDEAKQSSITQAAATTGQTTLSYNVNGHLQQARDTAAGLTTTYFNSANGLILSRERQQRNSRVGAHFFYYADGRRIGDVSDDPNDDTHVSYAESLARDALAPQDRRELYKRFKPVTSADFDQNFEPINAAYPGPTGSHYTARGGESLPAVAQSLWGDASLWFLLAEGNGLTGTETLLAGQVLWVPNKVTNIHNNSQTVRPYDVGEAIGRIDPTLPPPPPPPSRGDGCGPVATVIMVAVAVVVSIYTAGAASALLTTGSLGGLGATMGAGAAVLSGGAGFSTATLAAATIGGAVGNIASQGVGLAMGAQDQFRWEAVGQAALASAVSSGVGTGLNELGYPPTGTGGWQGSAYAAGRAAAATSVDRLLQGGWTWQAVAASAVSAGLNHALTPDVPAAPTGEQTKRAWYAGIGRSMAADLAGQWVGRKDHHVDGGSTFASTLGHTIGDDVVDAWSRGQATMEADAPASQVSPRTPTDERLRADLKGFLAMDTDELLQQDFKRYLEEMQGQPADTADWIGGSQVGGGVPVPRPVDWPPRVRVAPSESDGLFGMGLSWMDRELPSPWRPGASTGPRPLPPDAASENMADKPGLERLLRLGSNERYRSAIVSAADAFDIAPEALAALISAEAVPLKGQRLLDARDELVAGSDDFVGPLNKRQRVQWNEMKKELAHQWDPLSASTTSSARGLTQFLEETWVGEAVIRDGYLNARARALGLIDVRNKVIDKAGLLQLRHDPELSIAAAAAYGSRNLKDLRATKVDGVPLLPEVLTAEQEAKLIYLAHHEGLSGAKRLLRGDLSETQAMKSLTKNVPDEASRRTLLDVHAGSAAKAYTAWLNGYIEHKIRPEKFR